MNFPLLPRLSDYVALTTHLSPLIAGTLGLLFLVALLVLGTTLVRLVRFARRGTGRSRSAEAAMAVWLEGDGAGAMARTGDRSDVRLRVFHALLTALSVRPGDADNAQASAGQAALEELAVLSRGQRGLEAASRLAPVLGLLGTVLGLTETLLLAASEAGPPPGTADAVAMTAGAAMALTPTAAGLALALVFALLALWFEAHVARERTALEQLIFRALNGPPSGQPEP